MLSAISGSMNCRRRRHHAERRQRQRHGVADGEGRDDRGRAGRATRRCSSRPSRNSRWSGPIAMWYDARRHERAEHRADALPRPGVIGEGGVPGVENRLLTQGAALVDVHERLVVGVVGEERRVEVDPARRARGRRLHRELQALAIGHRRDVPERDRRRLPVELEAQAAGEHAGQRWPVAPRHRRDRAARRRRSAAARRRRRGRAPSACRSRPAPARRRSR